MANIQKNTAEELPMEEDVTQGNVQQAEVDPKLEEETQAYITGLMKMLHSKDTSRNVVEMLSAGAPEKVIPQTALLINQQMEDAARSKGKPPSLEVLLNAGIYLTQDLIEIGNTAGIFEIVEEQEVGSLIQNTMQQYIEKGLKDKTIDPIELQEKIEPLMDEEHRNLAMEAGSAAGLPAKPDQMTAMEHYASKREQGVLKGVR